MGFGSGYSKTGASPVISPVEWRESRVLPEQQQPLCEISAIIETLSELEGPNRDSVLATVVHVTGPAYRRPGARMLLVPDGRRVGCVTGANLDADVAKQAWWLTESRLPAVRTCGPSIIILERTNTPELSQMFNFVEEHRKSRMPVVIATVIRVADVAGIRPGDRLLLDESWARSGTLAGSVIETQVITHATAALREKKSRLARLGQADVFVEWLGPPISLVLLGGGRDTNPLLRFARQLGWDVAVIDPDKSSDPLSGIDLDEQTAVVIMTHNYELDAVLLSRILPLRPSYLGLLGPKKRAERLFAEIGHPMSSNVHAPAGLDLGGDSPEIVALSVVAEVQAQMSHRSGGMLKRRAAGIHAPALEKGLPNEASLAAAHAVSHAR